MKVKICGITSVGDAEAAVEAGADMVGLMFYPGSRRHITVETAHAIERQLPPFIVRVGVFADPAPEDVFSAMRQCGLNLLQFHGHETPEFCRQFGMMTMKAFRIRDADSLREMRKELLGLVGAQPLGAEKCSGIAVFAGLGVHQHQ